LNLSTARALAEANLADNGLSDWTVEFDNAKSRHGQCRYRDKVISLSRHCVEHCSADETVDTILHEIAHALVGSGHGHDQTWKLKCIELGCRPDACASEKSKVPFLWTGTCPSGKHEIGRRRLTQSARKGTCPYCSDKFDPQYRLTWKRNDATQ
jgi:predicted SprT family Zn-dependent metalloprotease